jgi:SAM-dependent methyltransferase
MKNTHSTPARDLNRVAQATGGTSYVPLANTEKYFTSENPRACPACSNTTQASALERYGAYELHHCLACDLQFWEPREMPDARWYERVYGARDATLLPLEPGHKYFLSDVQAPGKGELLDIGCGTGAFLAAAHSAGYQVTGTELDSNAARFAKERFGLRRVTPLTIAEFVAQHPDEQFDVVTFFEVLEHQAAPREFLEHVKTCLRPQGYIALSVPNRERWLTGVDVLDYPPNHFLRWNVRALHNALSLHGFELLTVREQGVSVPHVAQMINTSLRTGWTQPLTGQMPPSFRDLMQMALEEGPALRHEIPSLRERAVQALGRMKLAVCYPLAAAAFPYFWWRGYKGTYLYCLARQRV